MFITNSPRHTVRFLAKDLALAHARRYTTTSRYSVLLYQLCSRDQCEVCARGCSGMTVWTRVEKYIGLIGKHLFEGSTNQKRTYSSVIWDARKIWTVSLEKLDNFAPVRWVNCSRNQNPKKLYGS